MNNHPTPSPNICQTLVQSSHRLLHYASLAIAVSGCLILFAQAAVIAQTVSNYRFDPPIVSTSTFNVLLEVQITGLVVPTQVRLEHYPLGYVTGTPTILLLRDDGRDGDKAARDKVYTVKLNSADIVSGVDIYQASRRFVGYLKVYQSAAVTATINVVAGVFTPDLPLASVTTKGPGVKATDYVVNIVDTSYFNGDEPYNFQRVAQTFYRYFPDDYDMLSIITDDEFVKNPQHYMIKNDVIGTGYALVDESASYGSGGRLLGLNKIPGPTRFDGADLTYHHEIGHQWINHTRTTPFGPNSHWPYSSMATGIMGFGIGGTGVGGMYPCKFVQESGGVRMLADNSSPGFNDLDLYLMGLLPAAEVTNQLVFADQTDPAIRTCTGQLYTGAVLTVNAGDIIARNGLRVPAVATTFPQTLKIANIVVSRKPLNTQAMSYFTYYAKRAESVADLFVFIGFGNTKREKSWSSATRGRGKLVTALF